jgi:hypothetical protein
MALEIAILFAKVTGRVLVLSPPAVLYLLHMNKKWDDNKSSVVSEYIYYLFTYITILSAYVSDGGLLRLRQAQVTHRRRSILLFHELINISRAGEGVETLPMKSFLDEVARKGMLRRPLPLDQLQNNDSATFLRTPLWQYLGNEPLSPSLPSLPPPLSSFQSGRVCVLHSSVVAGQDLLGLQHLHLPFVSSLFVAGTSEP